MVIKLKKPYKFEGKNYDTIDLDGLANLTVNDAIEAQKAFVSTDPVLNATPCETAVDFHNLLAAKTTGQPIEFFRLAPRRISRAVRAACMSEMATGSKALDGHTLRFDAPYSYGKDTYTEVDMSGVGDLNAMDESAAEMELVRSGFTVVDSGVLILYTCILASKGTKLPLGFFTGLPIRYLLSLKSAVNSSDFFE